MNLITVKLRKLKSSIIKIYYTLARMILNIKVKEFDEKILNQKRVIVIGPAETALNYMSCGEIDGFDFVIRVNKSHLNLKNYTDKIGTKTDILFHCCAPHPVRGCGEIDENALIEQHNKYVIYPYDLPNEYYFDRCLVKNTKINLCRLNKKYFQNILLKYKGKFPTTGFQVLNFLLLQDLKELHITGFTFLKTPYINGYRSGHETPQKINEVVNKGGYHNTDAELALFCELIENRDNVFMDQTLKSIVEEFRAEC